MEIPTDPKELAQLLDVYSNDWFESLHFIEKLCGKYGIEFDRQATILEIRKLQGDLV